MNRRNIALAVCLIILGCDGPQEDAGERIDAKSGATDGTSSIISGPAERRGEELDRLARQQKHAAETNASR